MSSDTIVEYTIFCPRLESVDLQVKLADCNKFISTLIHDYIWQKEKFELFISRDADNTSFSGSTNVGENINDEWFIVYLLMQLSKHHNDVIIRITDSDGCFLLIEAAEYLPRWVKPDNSENRVFIQDGSIHLLQYPSTPAEVTIYPGGIPTLQQAYNLILQENIPTKATDQIQQCIHERIKEYPDKVLRDFHNAHCFVPEEVVYVLQKNSGLVAAAVEAFYNRDHLDVKTCKKLSSFNVNHQVCANIRFTRHLYCQLQQANFYPDRKSKWALPPVSDKMYKAKELGFKLACGFEILISRYTSSKVDGEPYGKKWEQYLSNLKKNDFFQNELEGSKRYKELLKEAKQHFKQNITDSMDEFGENLLGLIKEALQHRTDIQKSCKELQPQDSDDWMTVSPEELDRMMIGIWGKQRPPPNDNKTNDDPHKDETQELGRLVDNMKLFVDKVSSFEGVEVPDGGDEPGIQPQSTTITKTNEKIDFDPQKFMESIHNLLSPQPMIQNEAIDSGNDSELSDEEGIDDEFISCDPLQETKNDGFHDVMYKMDDELRGTSIPNSFKDGGKDTVEGNGDELDYDVNLIRNFLESFSSQDGLSGPVSNIIQSMGLSLPPNIDEDG